MVLACLVLLVVLSVVRRFVSANAVAQRERFICYWWRDGGWPLQARHAGKAAAQPAQAFDAAQAFHHFHEAAAFHFFHHVLHLLEFFQQAVDFMNLHTRACGNAALARCLDKFGLFALLPQ